MRGARRVITYTFAMGAVGALVAWWTQPTERDALIERYATASCVTPHSTPTGRRWSQGVARADGSSVQVSGEAFVGGLVAVRYPDGTTRHVTALRDYVYPHDIRLDPDSRTLWIVTSGLAAGIWPEAHLYEYDIATRIAHEVEVAPDSLPEACPIPAPLKT